MKKIVILCFGTPLYMADAFGPLVGSLLEEEGYTVYGTMDNPLDGPSIKKYLPEIIERHKDDLVIAIDSSLTQNENKLHTIEIRKGGLRPGSAIGRDYPFVGDYNIKYFSLKHTSNMEVLYRQLMNYNNEEDLYECTFSVFNFIRNTIMKRIG